MFPDLENVATADLCEELKKRFDASCFIGVLFDVRPGLDREYRYFTGNHYTLEGMLLALRRRVIASDESLPADGDDAKDL